MEKAEIFETVECIRPLDARDGDADAMGDDVSCDEVSMYSVQRGLVILIPQFSVFLLENFSRVFFDSVNWKLVNPPFLLEYFTVFTVQFVD